MAFSDCYSCHCQKKVKKLKINKDEIFGFICQTKNALYFLCKGLSPSLRGLYFDSKMLVAKPLRLRQFIRFVSSLFHIKLLFKESLPQTRLKAPINSLIRNSSYRVFRAYPFATNLVRRGVIS